MVCAVHDIDDGLRVGVVTSPIGPDARLSAQVPHLKLYVLVRDRLHVEPDGCMRQQVSTYISRVNKQGARKGDVEECGQKIARVPPSLVADASCRPTSQHCCTAITHLGWWPQFLLLVTGLRERCVHVRACAGQHVYVRVCMPTCVRVCMM